MKLPDFHISNEWILSVRGTKNKVDPSRPYAFLIEKELSAYGKIEDVVTIFLTNRECPFRCLMCDLWKNTTNDPVSIGAIPRQIEYALERLPSGKTIKLYNSGNFFDNKAISPKDHEAIIKLLQGFETVLIENHPKLIDHRVMEFRDKLKANLQVGIGLETVHPQVLTLLNKQMTLENFSDAVQLLQSHGILSRAFILLRPPFLNEAEGIEWAKKSIDFAFDCGVECCSVIPTRPGNGALNMLEIQGLFQPPQISSLEEVQEYGISLNEGRVFADMWDLEHFSDCRECLDIRKARMDRMNLTQNIITPLQCSCTQTKAEGRSY